MARTNNEVIFEGWLTKSPPTKRIWRARWRRRWFSLTNSGELPGQFVLTYYADKHCRKLKGVINLDHCEQVDLGLKLEERKLKFDHVFDIKTPSRTYYLAADTESEMKSWVTCICRVCGLKSTTEDEDFYPENAMPDIEVTEEECNKESQRGLNNLGPSRISPVSTSPYIPISECITGKSPIFDKQEFNALLRQNLKNTVRRSDACQNNTYETTVPSQKLYLNYVNDLQDPRFYDCPRKLAVEKNQELGSHRESSPLQSPTDSENVFIDDEWIHLRDSSLISKRPSNSSADFDLIATEKFTKGVPPRPPKPEKNSLSPNYLNLTLPMSEDTKITETKDSSDKDINLDEAQLQPLVSDETYDFPRSHQVDNDTLKYSLTRRHCYNNAAPVKVDGQIFRYDISPKPGTSQIFRFDSDDVPDEPASPHSQSSSTSAYSNLASPSLTAEGQLMPPPPPVVNRDLKPRRKLSDSLSTSSNPEPSSPRGAPSVDRKLKPPTPLQESHMRKSFNKDEDKKVRAAPSPTPLHSDQSRENLFFNSFDDYSTGKMQYLDLDLDCNISNSLSSLSIKAAETNTVYKQVDFMKTQAFNITRNNLEKERQEPVMFHKK